MNPVKYEDLDFGSRYWITKQGYIYDTILEDFIPWAAYDRYPLCILIDVFGNHHNLMVHRVVAASWIGDVTNMVIHHINKNKNNPASYNLQILTPSEHSTIHYTGENNARAIFNEKDVHDVCKMLEDGESHLNIAIKMEEKLGKPIKVDSIDKIASGKNWKWISQQYDIKRSKREKMNQFSSRKEEIGKMSAEGMTVPEIAKVLGIEKWSKSYVALVKCVPRYRIAYQSKSNQLKRDQNGFIILEWTNES